MDALFIGGPFNGQVREVPDTYVIRFDDTPADDFGAEAKVGTYERQKFRLLGWATSFYVLHGLDDAERDRLVVEALIPAETLRLGRWLEPSTLYS